MAVKGSSKVKTLWFCSNCGNEYSKWMGKCPACGEWNTMVEREAVTGSSTKRVSSLPSYGRKPVRLQDVSSTAEDRISLGSSEVDRLLGGGLVKGSLVLIGGEPGIGKSTLSLQLPLPSSLQPPGRNRLCCRSRQSCRRPWKSPLLPVSYP